MSLTLRPKLLDLVMSGIKSTLLLFAIFEGRAPRFVLQLVSFALELHALEDSIQAFAGLVQRRFEKPLLLLAMIRLGVHRDLLVAARGN